MKKTGILKVFVIASAISFCTCSSNGQSVVDSLTRADKQILVFIAQFSRAEQSMILDVAQYPRELKKMKDLQARSCKAFRSLIQPFPREEQENIYQVSRFPGVLHRMVINGPESRIWMKNFLRHFPSQLREQIMDMYDKHFDLVVQIDDINLSLEQKVQSILEKYPFDTQGNFSRVLSNPDVMNVLTDNIDLTITLGEVFEYNQNETLDLLEQMHKKSRADSTQSLANYAEFVMNNPALQEEMKAAANYFADNNQYDNINYIANEAYGHYSYSYWFEYPPWYKVPIWYPLPMVRQTGFVVDQAGGVIIHSMPAALYAQWLLSLGMTNYPVLQTLFIHLHNLNVQKAVLLAEPFCNWYGNLSMKDIVAVNNLRRWSRPNQSSKSMNNFGSTKDELPYSTRHEMGANWGQTRSGSYVPPGIKYGR